MFLEERAAAAMSAADAERIAADLYGIAAVATALPGEYDCNFHLREPGGREFVLKCMHPAREKSFIEMQCATLNHLSTHAPHLPLPRVQRNSQGQLFAGIVDGADQTRVAWMLSFLPGATLEKTNPHSTEILEGLGKFLGELDSALQNFAHPGVHRELKWDSSRAAWIRDQLHHLEESSRRALVEYFISLYEEHVEPLRENLRRSVIYGDANDHNVLVSPPWPQPRKVAGVIDFGDMHYGWTVSEATIAAAYAILGKENPLSVATAIARGFHRAFPLTEPEIAALFPLIGMRLAVSVVNSAVRKKQKPGDPYVIVTEDHAWVALEQLAKIHPRFAHYTLRDACGLRAVPNERKIASWLEEQRAAAGASVIEADLRTAPLHVFDLSAGSAMLGADPGGIL